MLQLFIGLMIIGYIGDCLTRKHARKRQMKKWVKNATIR